MPINAEHLCIGILFAVAIWQQRKINRLADLLRMSATVQRHHVEEWARGTRIFAGTIDGHHQRLTSIEVALAAEAIQAGPEIDDDADLEPRVIN